MDILLRIFKDDLANRVYDLLVIGGGAAGFFGAIEVATRRSGTNIIILEKTSKLLTKVRVSGGGRCNVTHAEFNPFRLASHYPRGHKKLKEVFKSFHAADTVEWFRQKGVELKEESDHRMFPRSNSSVTIVNCLEQKAEEQRIEIRTNSEVISLTREVSGFRVSTASGDYLSTCVLLSAGGSPKLSAYDWIKSLGVQVRDPIPSLFTFNIPDSPLHQLMGLSVPTAEVRIEGTRMMQHGPVLITHWGLSGPAVIRLSAWAAEHLSQRDYVFTICVNWVGSGEQEVRSTMKGHQQTHQKRKVETDVPFEIPARLWSHFCEVSAITNQPWSELSNKSFNKLVECLVNYRLAVKGKTTFKEEFVTCGGVDLSEVKLATMECTKYPGLFFAGEILDIDGETGGFNFQAAWSTAFIAARSIVQRINERATRKSGS